MKLTNATFDFLSGAVGTRFIITITIVIAVIAVVYCGYGAA